MTADRREQQLARAASEIASALHAEAEQAISLLRDLGVAERHARPLVEKLQLSAATRAYDAAVDVIRSGAG